jgi:hypothetical protein
MFNAAHHRETMTGKTQTMSGNGFAVPEASAVFDWEGFKVRRDAEVIFPNAPTRVALPTPTVQPTPPRRSTFRDNSRRTIGGEPHLGPPTERHLPEQLEKGWD